MEHRYTNFKANFDSWFLRLLVWREKHIKERNFVLVPLAEILPQWEHPVLHKNMAELLADCPDRLDVKKL